MATRFANPFPRFFTDNAALLSGGKLYFYVDDGGTTPKNSYSDNALSVANTNPVILSSSGVIPDIFLDGTYRIVLQNGDGVQIDSAENVNSGSSAFVSWADWDSGVDYASGPATIVTGSNGKYYKSIDTPNQGNDPISSPAFWSRVYLIGDTDPVQGGTLDSNDQIIKKSFLLDYGETVNIIGSTGGGTQSIDLTLGNVVSLTVDTSTNTFTFDSPSPTAIACGITLWITNGGSQTINWPASVDWPGVLAPTLTTSGVDKLVFETVDNGTLWQGNLVALAYA